MKFVFYLSLIIGLIACGNNNTPNVSNINVPLKVERFEKDFFNIDTNNTEKGIDDLQKKYESFAIDYLFNILGATPQKDSTVKLVNLFLKDDAYNQVNKDAQSIYANFDTYKKEIELSFKYIKHYFPSYQLPHKIITFIGPLDGVGTALTSSHDVAIGLQSFLGANYAAYQLPTVREVYPTYQTKKFTPDYISTAVTKNIVEEIFPYKSAGRPLIEQMVEKGKRLYLLHAFLPHLPDSVKLGYTPNQISECNKNEAFIYTFFVQNNLLFEREASIIVPFITDGPKTQELSETAPGNIGSFVGFKIVTKWMKKNSKRTLNELMKTPATIIFNEANYKP